MAINETVSGNDSVAITGTATPGERTIGVRGHGESIGVEGVGTRWHGVVGMSSSTIGGFGVYGANTAGGTGVVGESRTWMGVYGRSESTTGGAGVMGEGVGPGVIGKSQTWMGVHGETSSTTGGAGVSGRSMNPDGTVNQDGLAGFFDGKVVVSNDIVLSNADCAEEFDVAESETIEPGTVMVIDDTGVLRHSRQPYDKRVAGTVSGAGGYRPAIVLDKQNGAAARVTLALLGKVFCKVDAQYGAIEVGDLLTTSSTPGHAMKASEPLKAFGAVIGKALGPLPQGQGLVPILIALQ